MGKALSSLASGPFSSSTSRLQWLPGCLASHHLCQECDWTRPCGCVGHYCSQTASQRFKAWRTSITSVESRNSEPASAHHLPDLFIILARLHVSDSSSRRQRLLTMAATVPSGKREFIVGVDFGTTTSVLAFAEKPKPGVDFDHNSIKLVTTQVKSSYHLASLTNEQSM